MLRSRKRSRYNNRHGHGHVTVTVTATVKVTKIVPPPSPHPPPHIHTHELRPSESGDRNRLLKAKITRVFSFGALWYKKLQLYTYSHCCWCFLHRQYQWLQSDTRWLRDTGCWRPRPRNSPCEIYHGVEYTVKEKMLTTMWSPTEIAWNLFVNGKQPTSLTESQCKTCTQAISVFAFVWRSGYKIVSTV